MPAGTFDPSTAAQDKDFLAASYPDKIRYLASQDADFAKANPQDQIGYINHLLGKPAPGFASSADQAKASQSDSTLAQIGRAIPSAIGAGLSDIPQMAKGFANQVVNTVLPEQQLLPESVRSKVGLAPIQTPLDQAQQMAADNTRRKAAGYNLPYRVGAPVAEALGANVTGMEQAAQKGDVGGVIGHAAVPIALATAPLAVEGGLRVANRVLPSTTRAGTGLNMLTDSPDAAFANHPVETPNTLDAARKIRNELEITGEKPHAVIQNYLANEDIRGGMPEEGVAPGPPMSMYEARTTLKRVNDIIRNAKGFNADAPSKLAITNLKRFAGALDEDISAAANQHGFGGDYAAMRDEYHHGQQIIRAGDTIGAPIMAMAGYELGRAGGEGLGGAYLGGQIGKHAGRYTTGAAARAIVERNAGPPKLRSMPPTPEAYHRTILDAKEGRISPGEADRRIARAGGKVKVTPIPQPTE